MKYKSSNPMLRDDVFGSRTEFIDTPMTINGMLGKLLILTLIMMASAGIVYYQYLIPQRIDYVSILTTIGWIASLVLSFIIIFKAKTAPALAPFFALAEGAMVGGTSCFFEASYPGIVVQAVCVTMVTVFAMAFLYKTKLIVATEKFKSIIFTATFTIMIFYLIAVVLMFFNVKISYFENTFSPVFVTINTGIALLAAFNLIMDFDFIEQGEKKGLPSHYEWYSAVSLILTVVWLYFEILRLLARFRNK